MSTTPSPQYCTHLQSDPSTLLTKKQQLDQNCMLQPGVTLSDSDVGLDIGSNYNTAQSSWKGTIDEVHCCLFLPTSLHLVHGADHFTPHQPQLKIYDHTLTPIELVLLSGTAVTANDAPTSQFGIHCFFSV
jgi:hypothetical protein